MRVSLPMLLGPLTAMMRAFLHIWFYELLCKKLKFRRVIFEIRIIHFFVGSMTIMALMLTQWCWLILELLRKEWCWSWRFENTLVLMMVKEVIYCLFFSFFTALFKESYFLFVFFFLHCPLHFLLALNVSAALICSKFRAILVFIQLLQVLNRILNYRLNFEFIRKY